MNKVIVNKADLLKVLTKNRKNHEKKFKKAIKEYRKQVIQHLEYAINCAKTNKKIITHILLTMPENHIEDYDRVIGMLQMSTENEITIDDIQYRHYVLDKWLWMKQFRETSSSLSSSNSSSSSSLEDIYQG